MEDLKCGRTWYPLGCARARIFTYRLGRASRDHFLPLGCKITKTACTHKEEIHASYNIAPNKFATFVDGEAIRVSCKEKSERKAHPKGKGMVVLEVPQASSINTWDK